MIESIHLIFDRRHPFGLILTISLMAFMLAIACQAAAPETTQPAGDPAPARHWSFLPVGDPAPPPVKDAAWPRNDVDRFVLARLESNGLRPTAPADRHALLRRATFDLTGLPPTPEQIDAFDHDSSPNAFAKVVELLLASPQYGEKWGRHWLDIVRYADTAGENSDHPLPEAWRYRNWVIDAFNSDKPYDQFIREQIAGDLLAKSDPPEKYAERIIATGYLAIARRFGHDINVDMHLTMEDTIGTLGKSVLGLTIGCARCHNHKYDPMTTRDYYGLYGILESTRFAFPGCEPNQQPHDLIPLMPQSEIDSLTKPYEAELSRLNSELKQRESELAAARKELDPFAKGLKAPESIESAATAARAGRDAFAAKKPVIPVAYGVTEGTPVNSKIQKRGEPKDLGDEVPRKFIDVLGGQTLPPEEKGSGRLELAGWLINPANPLTARVMVNRIWQHHFGTGIVATPNDFGTRGAAPTDPPLLDYLATQFVRDGWSVKAMHRLIMLSAAYQQTASDGDVHEGFARRRLGAEEIRDSLLACSGEIDLTPGQAHPFPPTSTWGFSQHVPFTASYPTNKRSVYVMRKRNTRDPFFSLFDGPDPNDSTPLRQVTIMPTQALFFLNDPFVYARASALSRRLAPLPDDRARLDLACRLLFTRPASDADFADFQQFQADYRTELQGRSDPDRLSETWTAYVRVLFGTNEFLYVD